MTGSSPRTWIASPAARNDGARRKLFSAAVELPPSRASWGWRRMMRRPDLMTEATMKYMLLIYRNEADMLTASKAQAEQTMGAYMAYTEAKEQLGGYYLIDVPDLDVALSWAARCPGASHGTIEVRPLWVM